MNMKKLFLIIAIALFVNDAKAQLTLSEKSALAETQSFRSRVYQALFAKANVFVTQTPTNLEWQKKVKLAKAFVSGTASGYDIAVLTRFWLANYNGVPVLDANNQPTDLQITSSNGLDVVFNVMAGINPGDDQLPVE